VKRKEDYPHDMGATPWDGLLDLTQESEILFEKLRSVGCTPEEEKKIYYDCIERSGVAPPLFLRIPYRIKPWPWS
jgi:hypothetical protein